MCLLLETIKIVDGKPRNLEWHNSRMNHSRKEKFGISGSLDLNELLHIPDEHKSGIIKCRVIYSESIKEIHYSKYLQRDISSLKCVSGDHIDYSLKYVNRSGLVELLTKRGNCDDILIIKNNFVTDTSFSNIVFYDGSKWITPTTPLLKGTQREKLITGKVIMEEEIRMRDIKKFKKAKLINALLEFNGKEIDIKDITL